MKICNNSKNGDGGSRTLVQNGIKQASTCVASYYLAKGWEDT